MARLYKYLRKDWRGSRLYHMEMEGLWKCINFYIACKGWYTISDFDIGISLYGKIAPYCMAPRTIWRDRAKLPHTTTRALSFHIVRHDYFLFFYYRKTMKTLFIKRHNLLCSWYENDHFLKCFLDGDYFEDDLLMRFWEEGKDFEIVWED